jgi:V8-like Glu-specific endopeptidase
MTSDAPFGRRKSHRWPAAVALAAAALLLAALPAAAGGYLPLGARPAAGAAIPATWFTDRPDPEEADPAKDPCVAATGQLRIGDRFLGTASLVLDRRVVLTASHVPWLGGKPQDRFAFLLGFDRGRAAFIAEATVVARGSYYSDSGGNSHYRASDWAIAVLDKPAPAGVAPLAIYQGQPEDLLGRRLWIQGYAVSYAAGAAPFIARGCAVEKIDSMDGRLHNSCSADHGTSGAPLMTMQQGACSVVGIEAGGLADQRPAPFSPRIANMATSPTKFRHAAAVVQELLASGMDAEEIKSSLGKVAALDLP